MYYADIGAVALVISATAALSKLIEFLYSGLKARLNKSKARIEIRKPDGTSISVSVDTNNEEGVRRLLEVLGEPSEPNAPTDKTVGGQDG